VNRLRRLDALFAERVLGCKVNDPGGHVELICTCKRDGGNWPLGGGKLFRHGTGPVEGGFLFNHLPSYTRSLDAAWEGAANLRGELFSYGIELGWMDGLAMATMMFPRDGLRFSASASHPAEALVLACLRAVDVTEEKIV